MLNHNFRQRVVHEGLRSIGAKAAELLTAPLSFPLSLSHRWTGAPLKPCSSGPSPNCRALGGLLFIAVKALTPYCAVVSGWIQHRALLCRPQLFYAWVGWLGGSGSGHIFQIRLDGLTISLCFVCVLLSLSLCVSVWWLHVRCLSCFFISLLMIISHLYLHCISVVYVKLLIGFHFVFWCVFWDARTAHVLVTRWNLNIWPESSNVPPTFSFTVISCDGLGDFQAAMFSHAQKGLYCLLWRRAYGTAVCMGLIVTSVVSYHIFILSCK